MTYKPGDQPDPEFTAFFAGPWQKLLEGVVIPGTDGKVSWDRRAAYLLWLMGSHYDAETPWHWLDVMKHAIRPAPPVPVGINHIDIIDCTPTPGGVPLQFNSSKFGGERNG